MRMKKNVLASVALLFVVGIFMFSCNDNSLQKIREAELATLATYISEHNITVEPTSTGLYYIETLKGDGDSIRVGDRVQVWYKTYLIDSTLLDESGNYDPYEFIVGSGAIEGLMEAVTYMNKGGKADLIIPSELAYGQQGSSGVGAFKTLLMSVEIYNVFPYDEEN